MFEYVVVTNYNGIDIHKCQNKCEAIDYIMEYLSEYHSRDMEDMYLDYVRGEIECNWDNCPDSLNDWLRSYIESGEDLSDWEVYWE